jgi:glycosyltransferase involved in cell wall biosynthesis
MALTPDHVLAAVQRPGQRWDVLAFVGSLNVGGCERHLATVFPRLAAAGLKVGIVTFIRGGPLEQGVRASGVDVLTLDASPMVRAVGRPKFPELVWNKFFMSWFHPRFYSLIMIFQIARVLRSGRVGAAHFFLPGAYILGGLGAVYAKFSKTLMSRRSLNVYQDGHPIATKFEHFLHRRMRILSANARPAMVQLLAEGAPPERTLLLHSGVDLAQLESAPDRAASRATLGIAPDTMVIAIVANLIPYKGHADLIEALGQIAPMIGRPWILLVGGRDDGPGRAIAERADELGIGGNIRWLGSVQDVPALWRAADIGVLASHQEGLPNSLLESMAAGVAMVTTDVGGVTDIATDEVDALLVPSRNPQAMAKALMRMISDDGLRTRLGDAAALRIRTEFSLDACVDSYLRLYRLMLANPSLQGADVARAFRSKQTQAQGIPA